jgi:hypothetical protein
MPKSASRTRSDVGRVDWPRGACNWRERSVPPVIRIVQMI